MMRREGRKEGEGGREGLVSILDEEAAAVAVCGGGISSFPPHFFSSTLFLLHTFSPPLLPSLSSSPFSKDGGRTEFLEALVETGVLGRGCQVGDGAGWREEGREGGREGGRGGRVR